MVSYQPISKELYVFCIIITSILMLVYPCTYVEQIKQLLFRFSILKWNKKIFEKCEQHIYLTPRVTGLEIFVPTYGSRNVKKKLPNTSSSLCSIHLLVYYKYNTCDTRFAVDTRNQSIIEHVKYIILVYL